MEMRNLVKEKIAANGYALGAFVASGSANNCEILAINGLDFIIIDMEHSQTDAETAVDMFRASELYGMAPCVRVFNPNDGSMMSRLLDVGAHGVMVPLCNTPEQVRNVVDNMKYAPLGHRGANGGRGPRWGNYADYIHIANDNTLTIVQCETVEAVENVEEIAAIPGVDCIFIGTGDLSLDMGLKFSADTTSNHASNDLMEEYIDRVLKACQKNGVIPGIVTLNADNAAKRIKQGFQFVTCMNDLGIFSASTKQRIADVKELLK